MHHLKLVPWLRLVKGGLVCICCLWCCCCWWWWCCCCWLFLHCWVLLNSFVKGLLLGRRHAKARSALKSVHMWRWVSCSQGFRPPPQKEGTGAASSVAPFGKAAAATLSENLDQPSESMEISCCSFLFTARLASCRGLWPNTGSLLLLEASLSIGLLDSSRSIRARQVAAGMPHFPPPHLGWFQALSA